MVLPWLTRGPHLSPGMRLGKYRIVRLLAVGGMAEIFLARVEGLRGFEKLVACKRILPEYNRNANLVRMFLDEARLMARLSHANITQVHDVGSARGSYFFAMEYVHGHDLRTIARAVARTQQAVPLDVAIGIIAETAAGLHHAHEMRGADGESLAIVHRDVSPSNVLVSYEGAVKITDFGVAKWTRQQTETRAGTLKGKTAYMSPEQCRGEALDRRSDVFSLGVLLYELTTGTRLFQGASDFAILNQIVSGEVPPPSTRVAGYPPALERVVLRALARERERRFDTARDVQLALESFAHAERMVLTPMVRARFVQRLFATKVSGWKAAAEAGRSLGQYLASLPDEDVVQTGGDDEVTAATGEGPVLATGKTLQTPALKAERSRMGVRGLAVAAGVVALAVGLWLTRHSQLNEATAPTLPRLPPPRATPVVPPVAVAQTPTLVPASGTTASAPHPPPRSRVSTRRIAARPARSDAPATPSLDIPAPAATPAAPSARERVKIWDPDSVFLPK